MVSHLPEFTDKNEPSLETMAGVFGSVEGLEAIRKVATKKREPLNLSPELEQSLNSERLTLLRIKLGEIHTTQAKELLLGIACCSNDPRVLIQVLHLASHFAAMTNWIKILFKYLKENPATPPEIHDVLRSN